VTSDDALPPLKSKFQKEIEQLQLLQNAAHNGQESTDSKEEKNKDDDQQSNTEKKSSSGTNDKKQLAPPNATPKDEESQKKDENNFNKSEISSSPSSKSEFKKKQQQEREVKVFPEANGNQQELRQNEVNPVGINAENVQNNEENNDIIEQPNQHCQQQQSDSTKGGIVSWLIDPLLQCIIVLLAIICYLFIRKVKSLVEELQALDS